MKFTINCTLSLAEQGALYWLAQQGNYTEAIVERHSPREFDLGIKGKYEYQSEEREPSIRLDDGSRPGYERWQMGKPTGRMETVTMGIGGWLPLACLKVWWGDRKWGRYVDDCGTGDWSFVRDAEPEQIWAMFHSIVSAARTRSTPARVRNTTQGYTLTVA